MSAHRFKPGVLYGDDLHNLYAYAKDEQFALPAVNVVNTSSINAVLEAAKEANSPVIIQFSSGGGEFFAGKALDNSNFKGSALGAISGAHHIHTVAQEYEVSVVIHTDHAERSKLPWIDQMISASEEFYKIHKKPLFSSHMLDLSEESLEDNVKTCKEYLQKLSQLEIYLEFELGITGGEEDGVDNTDKDQSLLYTQPEEVEYAYKELVSITDHFLVAAAFGNVHGVYKPGNVQLKPELLKMAQEVVAKTHNLPPKPMSMVFHGGSGSPQEKIREAISYGVVKMNIDTDTQWAFWDGVRKYIDENHAYLQAQIGNPEGDDLPNKKKYDPRAWLREGEKSLTQRVLKAYEDLDAMDRN
ncbi:class II fructose-bisphosphate aldolase [Candidatus Dojkabacteria bacterium]|uniref:Fructose-bisphosphate aldolase n=1 Tax=Candidatus Dojkabacteria bacterium TaxID=2099670 RepID=A0A955L9A0_9BACT|nr:class II fructose-bisphosphate aldolase [Candidatus Dojkabacteria bacterium]